MWVKTHILCLVENNESVAVWKWSGCGYGWGGGLEGERKWVGQENNSCFTSDVMPKYRMNQTVGASLTSLLVLVFSQANSTPPTPPPPPPPHHNNFSVGVSSLSFLSLVWIPTVSFVGISSIIKWDGIGIQHPNSKIRCLVLRVMGCHSMPGRSRIVSLLQFEVFSYKMAMWNADPGGKRDERKAIELCENIDFYRIAGVIISLYV